MRNSIISSLIGERRRGLEIGPSHSPTFPKAAGFDVETLDHASAAEIREKYRAMGVDVSNVEEVDFVSDGRPIHEVIPHRDHYDFIFASNVIEHVTDLVAFFNSCDALLKHDGVLVLTVPDKRFCFDAMQSVTMTGEVLQAHLDQRNRHYPGRAFDTISNIVSMQGAGAWPAHQQTVSLKLDSTVDNAKAMFDRMADPSSGYIDEHTWRFTPSSMRLILQDLNYLGLVHLREDQQVCYDGFEFFMSYSREGKGNYQDRLTWLHMIAREQVFGYQQLLNGFAFQP